MRLLFALMLVTLLGCFDYESGTCDYCAAKRAAVYTNACMECKSYHVSCGRERQLWVYGDAGVVIKICPKKAESSK